MTMIAAIPGGGELSLPIQPRSGRTEVAGPHGEANAELVRFLARTLGVLDLTP